MTRNEKLQLICRNYLSRLRCLAERHGLLNQLDCLIEMNKQKKCSSTEQECELLARICDDERLKRTDVPKVLGKSYRQSFEDGDFEKIKTLKHVGIYSKVSTLLFKENK